MQGSIIEEPMINQDVNNPAIVEIKSEKLITHIVFLYLIVSPIVMFFVTLPVILSGNFDNAFWFAGIGENNKKFLFYTTLALYPYAILMFPHLRAGKCSFYLDRLEIKSVFLRKTYILPYNKIHATLYTNSLGYAHISISSRKIKPFFRSPFNKIIHEYLNGFYIILHNEWIKNTSDIGRAIELLKANSVSFDVI